MQKNLSQGHHAPMPSVYGIHEILAEIRQKSRTEREKGTEFECLMKSYLKTTALYADRFKEVWLWMEFPYRGQFGGSDLGIDIVTQTYSGEYWAVQCKCYDEEKYISKPDVDSFITTSGKMFDVDGQTIGFSQRLLISTTNKWNNAAELTIRNQKPQVTRLNLIDLVNDDVDWEKLKQGIYGKASRPQPFTVKEHQKKAICLTHEYLKTHERGKLIMACGTGKTFTSLKIAEKETDNNGLVLFLVPSIALLGQTLRAWSQQADKPIHAVCICSDANVSKQEEKNEDNSTSIIDLALPASTDTHFIVQQLEDIQLQKQDGMTVVFSTYQSIEVVAQAQRELLNKSHGEYGVFNLIICDEAHRTTGVVLKNEEESAFVKVHDNDFLKAHRRIYMTATPRLYADSAKKTAEEKDAILCSMDDEKMYGEEIYRIGFGEAVEKQLLSDYRVLILAVGDKDLSPALQESLTHDGKVIPTDDKAKFVGCINALSKRVLGDEGLLAATDPQPMRRAVAFCSTIKHSKITSVVFTDCKDVYMQGINDDSRKATVNVVAHHVDGGMSATKRDAELMWLKEQTGDDMECRMLTNARCLSEGVDVPSLDAVVFVSPKNSQVDVVQAVGRVMRRSEGKKYGYIIIPVVVPEKIEGDEALEKLPNFKVVWTVLKALRAHDDRFNAEINKIELSKKKPQHIIFGGPATDSDNDQDRQNSTDNEVKSAVQQMAQQLSLQFEDLQNVFYAKMVDKVGSRRYWELWAKDIAKIADEHIVRIRQLINDEGRHRKTFDRLMQGLRKNINPNLTEQETIEMLSQHIISLPVFEALFGNYEFAHNNAVSKSMQQMLNLLEDETQTEEEHERLQKFYDYVRTTVGDITDSVGRQRLVVELYDKFFKVAAPKTVEKLGIVYTPVEVVDFIIHSVGYILQKEFGRSLSDDNVQILDPFTGTGTFITRLLQSGLISKDALPMKYEKEIHANEIVLLAYYIASVNIESVYHDLMQSDDYQPFKSICLTDTFQLGEYENDEKLHSEEFPDNSQRVLNQKKQRITVIVSNPPYSAGQKSANDNARNQTYPTLNARIAETYVAQSESTNKNSTYNSYIKAFRWASDRINPNEGGVIGFITDGAWIDSNAQEGFRKCLEREFSAVYVFNLRGNARTSGELRRKECGNVFDSGSRSSIAISILVKHPNKTEGKKARIYYHDIGDYLSRGEKLSIIQKFGSIGNPQMQWTEITPNTHGDWINHRNEVFRSFYLLGDKGEKNKIDKHTFFEPVYARGIGTSRDYWAYNFSKYVMLDSMKRSNDFYNEQRILYQTAREKNTELAVEDFLDTDPSKISWSRAYRTDIARNKNHFFDEKFTVVGLHRPFSKENLYFDKTVLNDVGPVFNMFPTSKHHNLVICTSSPGDHHFGVLITDCIPDLHTVATTQCFPLYYYEDIQNDVRDLFSQTISEEERYKRKDGITDFIWKEAQKQYGKDVTKEDLFYYVYGLLHSPDYRTAFATDLKKSLPRLPLVESKDDFWAFSKAGHDLAELHLNYETVEPYRKCNVIYGAYSNKGDCANYQVEKMRFGKKDDKAVDKNVIFYNEGITIEDIPDKAYEYVINGKSAIEWIMERYAVDFDPKSGITNDANDWAREHHKPRYILDLLLSVINVSVQTVDIVNGLPKLKFD